jgi:hypothetical protein
MPERWERELRKLHGVEVQEPSVRERIERGPTAQRPPGRERLVAAIVAFAVFGAAGAFAWRALSPSGTSGPVFGPGSWPVATVSLGSEPEGKSATLNVGGSTQVGVFGAATSPDEPYPYAWVNPTLPTLAKPLRVPMGSELELEGDVRIKELLYGDAEQLDAGRGPDSGPIWADQPNFSEPYFLPWDEDSERTYLKFFGTWADGSVLDVYFEVVFVAPNADLSDPTADIVVTPEPMGAVFLYGGQRSPMGPPQGGTYGNTSIVSEFAGFDERAIVAKVPAGIPLEVSGEHLVDASVRAGNLPLGEGARPLDGAVPVDPGRYVLTVEVAWDGGSATFLHQIEVVPAPHVDVGLPDEGVSPAPSPIPSPSPSAAPTGGIVVSIFGPGERSHEMPTATFSFAGETKTACTQDFEWTLEDGTRLSGIADAGRPDSIPVCTGPAIPVPPGTSIAIETMSSTRVFTTRATTQFFEGDVGLVVSAEWPEGEATFIVPLTVAFTNPDLELVVLDCRPEDQVPITGPDTRIEPAGSAYIVGNLPGFERSDVVEQMTRDQRGESDLAGVWQVVREGSVVASVEYPDLSGAACEGTGIGGA